MLELNRVALCFKQLSGCRDEDMEEALPIVRAAIKAVEDALDAAKVKDDDIPACEYAAVCTALYDYVCREASREQMVVTAAGNADTNADFSHRLKGAQQLKNEAWRRISRLMYDEDFIFETM